MRDIDPLLLKNLINYWQNVALSFFSRDQDDDMSVIVVLSALCDVLKGLILS